MNPNYTYEDNKQMKIIYEREKVKYCIIVYPDELKAKIFKHNGERF